MRLLCHTTAATPSSENDCPCGRPALQVFYAFDPKRTAILLIGSDKAGEGRFYERMIIADGLNDEPLRELSKGQDNG